jgi:hypothetical protein
VTATGATPAVDELTTSEAKAPPDAAGVKVTCTVQLFPMASVAPQVDAPKEKLLAEIPMIWKPTLASGAPPVLLTVTVCAALAWPTACSVKLRIVGLTLNTGGARPVPLKATVCGWVRVTSEMLSVPVCVPVAVGSNCTLIAQLEPAARLAVQLLVC